MFDSAKDWSVYDLPGNGKKGSNLGSNLGSNIGSRAKKRMIKEGMQVAILGVCNKWVSLDSIASAVQRNAEYLLTYEIRFAQTRVIADRPNRQKMLTEYGRAATDI